VHYVSLYLASVSIIIYEEKIYLNFGLGRLEVRLLVYNVIIIFLPSSDYTNYSAMPTVY